MAKRRRVSNSDSLDLFLDTICNAFGGLLFLAILLTLLVQMRSHDDSGSSQKVVSQVEIERLALEVKTAQRRREELSAQVAKLSQLAGKMDASPLQQKANAIEELQKKLEPLLSQIQSESQLVESMLREMREIEEQMANLEVELPRAREDLAQAKKNLSDSLTSRQQSVEAPVERMTLKSAICLLMRYNRVYLVFRDDMNLAVNTEHVEDVSSGKNITVRPTPSKGWDITSDAGLERFKTLLVDTSPEDRFVSIAVWPDSYGNFEKIKSIMIERNFNYELLPLTTQEKISYGVSNEASLVQ